MKSCKPEILGGFRDFLPSEATNRQDFLDKIRRVYERFGFEPLETPALERSAVLGTDDRDFDMEVYRFMAGDIDVSLRFDLTVPLSRVVAANPQLPKPFKRYQLGNVWRREKPQAGRFREFAQFDADIVGTASITADAEIVILIYNVMSALGVGNEILIRFNTRKIHNALPEIAGFPIERIKPVLRTIDKLEKIGIEKVKEELRRQPDNQFDDSAPALNEESIAVIEQFLAISGNSQDILDQLQQFVGHSSIGQEGILELKKICEIVTAYGIDSRFWTIDLSVARGLDYYTGPVFETTLLPLPNFGSVMSGGRFDGLIKRFTGQEVPAVGASVGVDRLFAALEKLNRLPQATTKTQVLIVSFDDDYLEQRIQLTARLRNNQINTHLSYDNSSIKDQIIYALKRGIPFILFAGLEELRNNSVTCKNLLTKSQTSFNLETEFDKLCNFLTSS